MHHDAITDIPGIRVGHWTDRDAATGCTVILCPPGTIGGVDVRGGAPGTQGTESLKDGRLVQEVHAVLLTGGSSFGLAATAGVLRWLEEQGVGLAFGGTRVPIVTSATLFDLGTGRADVRPGPDQGYTAAQSATDGPVEQGSIGAGTGATVAKARGGAHALKGGIGSASELLSNGVIVGALAAVNAVGEIVDSSTGAVVAGPRGEPGRFVDTLSILRSGQTPTPSIQNTTLAVVATNARLTKEQTNRLALVAHDGFARAIRPTHTIGDGDVVFALATGAIEAPDRRQQLAIETFAAVAVERAIVKAVLAATGLAGVPAAKEWKMRVDSG